VNWMSTVVSEATGTLRRASDGLKIAVNQDNILQAARIIESEAEHLEAQVNSRVKYMTVHAMGGDPVSKEVARVLNNKLILDDDSYLRRCMDYATMLHNLARQLGESARTYGFTEEVITARFDAPTAGGSPSPRHANGGLRAV